MDAFAAKLVWLQVIDESTGGDVMVSVYDFDDPPALAVTVERVSTVTAPAMTAKVAVVALALTVTLAGTLNIALSTLSATARSAAGAALKVTVQFPPPSLGMVLSHLRLAGTGVCTVMTRDFVTPFNVAFTVANWVNSTSPAWMVNAALLFPSKTVTVGADIASTSGSLLTTLTGVSANAALFRFT